MMTEQEQIKQLKYRVAKLEQIISDLMGIDANDLNNQIPIRCGHCTTIVYPGQRCGMDNVCPVGVNYD